MLVVLRVLVVNKVLKVLVENKVLLAYVVRKESRATKALSENEEVVEQEAL